MIRVSVIIPTFNPDRTRLHRTLAGLRAQSLDASEWETVIVDNASTEFPANAWLQSVAPINTRVVPEPQPGLSHARRAGLNAAHGEFAVLVDDDNVLAPNYLTQALRLFDATPKLGAAGGKSLPEFETEPPEWTREFFPLLALRDLGSEQLIAESLRAPGAAREEYPLFAPIGAGMVLRRAAWLDWLGSAHDRGPSDRQGQALTSGGDNDIVLCVLRAGWSVAYSPKLQLTHLIPAGRLTAGYLARLNRGIQTSWMQVLSLHNVNPWPPLTTFGATLRKLKAWFVQGAWRNPVAQIRWQGACGHFDGRVPRQKP
ncbi:MAG: glycosyltransferase [Opitutaceae bacterium]|nr:glycosyltransferase [Opitutaceae bacterium]